MSSEWSVDPATVPNDPPAGDRACPLCGGSDVRRKFGETASPITYCIDCMVGTSAAVAVVDMHIFESCLIQSDRKQKELF